MLLDNSQDYWENEFDITVSDVDRVLDFIREQAAPSSITVLASRIIRGRIRYGQDITPSALSSWVGKPTVRLWDPAEEWQVGDGVVVITKKTGTNSNDYGAFVGNVVSVDPIKNSVTVHLEIGDKIYEKAQPGSGKAIKWHNAVREIVAQKVKSAEIEDQVTVVLAQYGDRIVSRLAEVLEQDRRFCRINNYFFINELITPLTNTQIVSIYKKLIEVGKPLQLGEIKAACNPPLSEELIGDFILLQGLEEHPNLFEMSNEDNNTTWKSILPNPDQMIAQHYAYDPNTYEIICAPGKKLNKRSSQRLQELGLIAHVSDFMDELKI